MKTLSHIQFQSLSRCEAIQIAKDVERIVKDNHKNGWKAALKLVNKTLKDEGTPITFEWEE